MSYKPPGAESMASVLGAMQLNLPGVIEAIQAVQPSVARSQAAIDAEVSPLYAASQRELFDTEGRRLNEIGAEIETANQLAASRREAQIADEYGDVLVSAADRLGRLLDPEFYRGREQIASAGERLLGAMDPTRLTDNEREELFRASAAGGAVNPRSSAETAANAMTFGRALQDKQSRFGETLAQLTSVLPNLRTGMSGFEIGTRRALVANPGQPQFLGTQQGAGQNAWQTGNNFMQQAAQLQNTSNANRRSTWDTVAQMGNMVGGMFSFS